MQRDFAGLFEADGTNEQQIERLAEGAILLRGFARNAEIELVKAINEVSEAAPFRYMAVRGGHKMSVGMTNCGQLGWVSDENGYRYDSIDPVSGRPWPPIPKVFEQIAAQAARDAGFAAFESDACLINRYEPGSRMGLHQDKNERDYAAPIVSVSLGLAAVFLFGGMRRNDRPRRIRLESGDVVVWGGATRLAYHGVAPLQDGEHPVTGRCRINLTFRKAS
jgi:alkylated DNA repair protein (DNA oxidative demethylase)